MSKLTVLPAPAVPLPANHVMVVDEPMAEGHAELQTFNVRISKTNRKRFDIDALNRLSANLLEVGILQPILVRPVTPTTDEPQRYEIVAGERRFRAAVIAGLSLVPAIVRPLSDVQAIEIQLLENIQREDPHPLEEAEGYELLMQNHGYNADQLQERVKKSRTYIYNRLKLCRLSPKVRDMYLDEKFDTAIAELLARLPTPDMQFAAAKDVSAVHPYTGTGMSVRQARDHLRQKYTIDLKGAIFSIKDATLVAAAGPCTECPKRTGNQPDFDGDAQGGNVCTLPACYREKEAAHAVKARETAEKKGSTVIVGDAARKVMPSSHGPLRQGFADVDSKIYTNGGTTSYRKLLGKLTPTGTLVEHPYDKGKLVMIAKIDELEELVRQVAGTDVETEAARAAKSRAREKQQEKDAKIERQYRRELFVAVRDAAADNPPAVDERHVAALLFANCPNTEEAFIRKLHGWTGKEFEGRHIGNRYMSTTALVVTAIEQQPIEQVRQLIRDMTVVRELAVNTYTGAGEKPTRLLAAADVAGINAKAIRKRLVDEEMARQATKAKKARKSKAKPAQAEIPGMDPSQAPQHAMAEGTIDLAMLQDADALRSFIVADPARINEVTPLIVDQVPHLVKALDGIGRELGYAWKDRHWTKVDPEPARDQSASQPAVPGVGAAAEPAAQKKTLTLKPRTAAPAEDSAATGPVIRTKKPARSITLPGSVAYTSPEQEGQQ